MALFKQRPDAPPGRGRASRWSRGRAAPSASPRTASTRPRSPPSRRTRA
ncbi:MAG: hypothetical protein M0C28_42695 [Candidatus Moduliflexus flocculans]|nr:hypothetical protein [Candidatus Moduliflexus flocculans]